MEAEANATSDNPCFDEKTLQSDQDFDILQCLESTSKFYSFTYNSNNTILFFRDKLTEYY